MRARRVWLAALTVALAMVALAPSARAANVTIAPADPEVENCFVFGAGYWTPYTGWIYKDIPRFVLKRGDILAFDTGLENDVDIELAISLARTTSNGGDDHAQPFKTVVTNTQTPENPRGDDTVGNFELRFDVESKFKFRGGGLIIRFSDPSSAYEADGTCIGNLVNADATDPSGFFVGRFFNDADGVSPYDNPDDGSIGGFQITDLKGPQTKIKKGPKGETTDEDAKFKLKSDEFDSKFKCKLDGGRYKRCKKKAKFKDLDVGEHVLKVRAKDPAGNRDKSPAKRKWEVV